MLSFARTAAFLVILVSAMAARAEGDAAVDKAVQKSVKTLINAIRYSKDDLASKQLGYEAMVTHLLDSAWAGLSDADKKELMSGMEQLIRSISFPAGRNMFEFLDNVVYAPAKVEGTKARLGSTVVIHRDLKKTEIKIEWVLTQQGGAWRVYDTIMLGESTLDSIRDEQVKPLLKEGGTAAVLKAMRDKVAEAKAQTAKKK